MAAPYNYGSQLQVTPAAEMFTRGLESQLKYGTALQGMMEAGLTGNQNREMQLEQNARANAQEARSAEMHPLQMQGAKLRNQAAQQQIAAAEAERQRQALQQRAISDLMSNPKPTANDFARVIMGFPEIASSINQGWEMMDEARKEGFLGDLGKMYSAMSAGKPEIARDMLNIELEAAKNSNDEQEAAEIQQMLDVLEQSPEAFKTQLGLTMLTVGGRDYANLLDKNAAAGEVQSVKVYQNGTRIANYKDGSYEVTAPDMRVVTGAEAQEVIKRANDEETAMQGDRAFARGEGGNQADINSGGTAAASVEAGKIAQTMSTKALEESNKITATISSLEEAIAALDAGAKTGTLMRYVPNVTDAAKNLNNALDRLGLDVIGSVTFGALSEAELRIAMDVGSPRDMSTKGLRKWLTERRDAKAKLKKYLDKQAMFLSEPGNTVNDWLKYQEEKTGKTAPANWQPGTAPIRKSMDQESWMTEMQRVIKKTGAGEQLTPEEMDFLRSDPPR